MVLWFSAGLSLIGQEIINIRPSVTNLIGYQPPHDQANYHYYEL